MNASYQLHFVLRLKTNFRCWKRRNYLVFSFQARILIQASYQSNFESTMQQMRQCIKNITRGELVVIIEQKFPAFNLIQSSWSVTDRYITQYTELYTNSPFRVEIDAYLVVSKPKMWSKWCILKKELLKDLHDQRK